MFEAKRRLDITVKQWAQDIRDGLFTAEEFAQDEYSKKIVMTIMKNMRRYNGNSESAKHRKRDRSPLLYMMSVDWYNREVTNGLG